MRLKLNYYLLGVVVLILAGCSSGKKDWEEAKSKNTIQAYENFLKRHPEGPFADSAQSGIVAIYFVQAQATNTIQAYKDFLKQCPKGHFADSATYSIKVLSLEARAGEWSGTTEFGSFTFVVSSSGREIVNYRTNYEIGIVSGSLSPQDKFEKPIDEDGSFELSLPDVNFIFRGQFSEDGTSATGLWEETTPFSDTVSERWKIER